MYFPDDCLLSCGILWLQEPEVPDGSGWQRAAVQGPHSGRRPACGQTEADRHRMLQFALGENVWEPWRLVLLSFAQGPEFPRD